MAENMNELPVTAERGSEELQLVGKAALVCVCVCRNRRGVCVYYIDIYWNWKNRVGSS